MVNDIEDLCDSVLMTLKSTLPDTLDDINSKKAFKVDTPIPDPSNGWAVGEVLTLQFPVCFILPQRDVTKNDQRGYRKREMDFDVQFIASSDNNQTLTRLVTRYASAIDQSLQQSDMLHGEVSNLVITDRSFTGAMKHPKIGALIQAVKVSVKATVFTN